MNLTFQILLLSFLLCSVHCLPTYPPCSIYSLSPPDNNNSSDSNRQTSFNSSSKATNPDLVKSLPDYAGSLPEMYSGYLAAENFKQVFYTFAPATTPTDKFIVWLQGGPGCAGTLGLFSENGPIIIDPYHPTPQDNPNSWTKFANMLWVDQPFGTGYSQGEEPIASTVAIATSDFMQTLKSFYAKFPEMKEKEIYLVGESYGSVWGAYFAQALISDPELHTIPFGGLGIISGLVSDYETQNVITASMWLDHVNKLGLYYSNDTSDISRYFGIRNQQCGYAQVMERMQFPVQQSPIPKPQVNLSSSFQKRQADSELDQIQEAFQVITDCDTYTITDFLLYLKNHCMISYDITLDCSFDSNSDPLTTYLNRKDVQQQLHATRAKSDLVSSKGVFGNGCNYDVYGEIVKHGSRSILDEVVPELVKNKKVSFLAGALDFQILWTGSLLALQNTTWNGWQGFQEAPDQNAPSGFTLNERNLAFTLSNNVGHMAPSKDPVMVIDWIQKTLLD
ncbi:serine carboxypeptidase Sxa2 [Schizosaccharomyces cryophilus OY26]|uniref:Carboxypeptidase n=1 Tax=Schizosaccharomyces cryophilus (strain OY26 / ATCC MYA-4695 / CBS 11777 / NBRC 106824 / NRRL Y48691) TaxID=653667 RepID=S9XK69_SCHCR|nr:serine carboxypeptidase Sxa2, variant [Schizosaccharomyces cryophilus OY26]XP_013021712.1 serine carboxypeptidase Sxa2 [Schizosaccharomyces cryophilus OY26]EPY54100.1 serine carboxypeptidase Sxa2, variant [Schizosaccharomyces cryophilus OY26]EPY54101.1 serine carboxypeptidase Sxa2 [Schizosaccharomyces cryophilus OY26]